MKELKTHDEIIARFPLAFKHWYKYGEGVSPVYRAWVDNRNRLWFYCDASFGCYAEYYRYVPSQRDFTDNYDENKDWMKSTKHWMAKHTKLTRLWKAGKPIPNTFDLSFPSRAKWCPEIEEEV